MDTHMDTSQQDAEPRSHRGDKKQQHRSSSGDTAVARAAQEHSLAGHVLGAGHAPAALLSWGVASILFHM